MRGIAMENAFADFNSLELFFLFCAVVGGFFIAIKTVLQFVGGDADSDFGGADTHISVDHVDSDIGFKLLSMHGLSAFFMMFGLVGLALYRQSQVNMTLSVVGAVIAGLAAVWVVGKLFQGAAKLQSSGTLKTADAVGSAGTVYLTIPAGGQGRVSINFRNHQREFNAVAKNGGSIPTGSPIKVVAVNANILIVEKN
jgi:membrane protein implicated in regulation of membrane protease activity